MHGYHVLADVFMTLLASAFLMALAVVISRLSGRRKQGKGTARSDAE